jgi:hypothetical protein
MWERSEGNMDGGIRMNGKKGITTEEDEVEEKEEKRERGNAWRIVKAGASLAKILATKFILIYTCNLYFFTRLYVP